MKIGDVNKGTQASREATIEKTLPNSSAGVTFQKNKGVYDKLAALALSLYQIDVWNCSMYFKTYAKFNWIFLNLGSTSFTFTVYSLFLITHLPKVYN